MALFGKKKDKKKETKKAIRNTAKSVYERGSANRGKSTKTRAKAGTASSRGSANRGKTTKPKSNVSAVATIQYNKKKNIGGTTKNTPTSGTTKQAANSTANSTANTQKQNVQSNVKAAVQNKTDFRKSVLTGKEEKYSPEKETALNKKNGFSSPRTERLRTEKEKHTSKSAKNAVDKKLAPAAADDEYKRIRTAHPEMGEAEILRYLSTLDNYGSAFVSEIKKRQGERSQELGYLKNQRDTIQKTAAETEALNQRNSDIFGTPVLNKPNESKARALTEEAAAVQDRINRYGRQGDGGLKESEKAEKAAREQGLSVVGLDVQDNAANIGDNENVAKKTAQRYWNEWLAANNGDVESTIEYMDDNLLGVKASKLVDELKDIAEANRQEAVKNQLGKAEEQTRENILSGKNIDPRQTYESTEFQNATDLNRAYNLMDATTATTNKLQNAGRAVGQGYLGAYAGVARLADEVLGGNRGENAVRLTDEMATANKASAKTKAGKVGVDILSQIGLQLANAPTMLLGGAAGGLLGSTGKGAKALQTAVTGLGYGTSTAGQELQHAYDSGATKEQARASAAVSGLLETALGGLSEARFTRVFNGDVNAGAKFITNAIAKAASEAGISAVMEGSTEYLTSVGQNAASRIIYGNENKSVGEIVKEELTSKENLYAAGLGALMGGGMGAIGGIGNGAADIQNQYAAQMENYEQQMNNIEAAMTSGIQTEGTANVIREAVQGVKSIQAQAAEERLQQNSQQQAAQQNVQQAVQGNGIDLGENTLEAESGRVYNGNTQNENIMNGGFENGQQQQAQNDNGRSGTGSPQFTGADESNGNQQLYQSDIEYNDRFETKQSELDGRGNNRVVSGVRNPVNNKEPQEGTITKTENKNVVNRKSVVSGQGSVIKNPYDGKTPQKSKNWEKKPIVFSDEHIKEVENNINSAKTQANVDGTSVMASLKKIYKKVFGLQGGNRNVNVDGLFFDGKPYEVTLTTTSVGKVFTQKGFSKEKALVFHELDNIVKSADYVGSGKYVPHSKKQKQTTRFDYFENNVVIDGREYLVRFDVEVFPNTNNYRTHRIDKIEIDPVSNLAADPSPQLGATNSKLSLSKQRVTQNPENVNTENNIDNKSKKDVAPSKFPQHVMDSPEISQELKDRVKADEDIQTHTVMHNSDTTAEAKNRVENEGWTSDRFIGIDSQAASAVDVATGIELVSKYQDEGNYDAAYNCIEKLAEIGTKSGQAVQAFAILKRFSPKGVAYYAQKDLNRVYNSLSERMQKKYGEQMKLSEEDIKYLQTTMEEALALPDGSREQQVKFGLIQKRITDKIPATKGQSLQAFTRINMLANPKTIGTRNIGSNAMAAAVNTTIVDPVAALFDKILAKKTGVRTTTADMKGYGKSFKQGAAESIEDYKLGISTRDIEANRYDEDFSSYGRNWFIGRGKSFNEGDGVTGTIGKALNKIDRFVSFALEIGDRTFYTSEFNKSLQSQMKANNVKVPTEDMIETAKWTALKRTWQDTNALTRMGSQIVRSLNFGHDFGIGTILSPFIKTPVNLAVATIEYSPAGLVKALAIDARKLQRAVKKGDGVALAQKKFVDSMGKAGAGVVFSLVGKALWEAGILSGSEDDDWDKANFMKNAMGIQPYSIKIGDKSYTYNWALPLGGNFGIVADTMNRLEQAKETDDYVTSARNLLLDVLTTGVDVSGSFLAQQTFMQSLVDAVGAFDEKNVLGAVENMAKSAATQFIPFSSLMGQITAVFDDTSRRTSGKDVENIGDNETMQYIINNVLAKTPFASSKLQPVLDSFGREQERFATDNVLAKALISLLAPMNIKKENAGLVENGIMDLYNETGDSGLFPQVLKRDIQYGDKEYSLTGKEYTEYQKNYGQTAYNVLSKIMGSDDYKNADEKNKVAMVDMCYDYADQISKKKALSGKADFDLDSWVKTVQNKDNGISADRAIILRTYKDMFDEEQKESSDKQNAEQNKELLKLRDISDKGWDIKQYYQSDNAFKSFDAKGSDGKTHRGLKKSRQAEYLRNADIPESMKDYLWESSNMKGNWRTVK